jgi:hypothetical protein
MRLSAHALRRHGRLQSPALACGKAALAGPPQAHLRTGAAMPATDSARHRLLRLPAVDVLVSHPWSDTVSCPQTTCAGVASREGCLKGETRVPMQSVARVAPLGTIQAQGENPGFGTGQRVSRLLPADKRLYHDGSLAATGRPPVPLTLRRDPERSLGRSTRSDQGQAAVMGDTSAKK